LSPDRRAMESYLFRDMTKALSAHGFPPFGGGAGFGDGIELACGPSAWDSPALDFFFFAIAVQQAYLLGLKRYERLHRLQSN
jgi:hypothetical protein